MHTQAHTGSITLVHFIIHSLSYAVIIVMTFTISPLTKISFIPRKKLMGSAMAVTTVVLYAQRITEVYFKMETL